jgi:hypothetical protein
LAKADLSYLKRRSSLPIDETGTHPLQFTSEGRVAAVTRSKSRSLSDREKI